MKRRILWLVLLGAALCAVWVGLTWQRDMHAMAEEQVLPLPLWLYDALFATDFSLWALLRVSPRALAPMFDARSELVAGMTLPEAVFLDAMIAAFLPVTFRRAALWMVQLLPATAARQPLPGQTIFALDLAFALPLTALTAWLLWRGSPVGDLLAIPMLIKVAVLGVSVFLGTFYTWALFDEPFMGFDLALYALMGFGPPR